MCNYTERKCHRFHVGYYESKKKISAWPMLSLSVNGVFSVPSNYVITKRYDFPVSYSKGSKIVLRLTTFKLFDLSFLPLSQIYISLCFLGDETLSNFDVVQATLLVTLDFKRFPEYYIDILVVLSSYIPQAV